MSLKINRLMGRLFFSGNRGFAQIPIIIALLLMAVAIPVASKLLQQNQQNLGHAADCSYCNGLPSSVQQSCIATCQSAAAQPTSSCKPNNNCCTSTSSCSDGCGGTVSCTGWRPPGSTCTNIDCGSGCEKGGVCFDSCGGVHACTKQIPANAPPATPTQSFSCSTGAITTNSNHCCTGYVLQGNNCVSSAALSGTPVPTGSLSYTCPNWSTNCKVGISSCAAAGLLSAGGSCPSSYICCGAAVNPTTIATVGSKAGDQVCAGAGYNEVQADGSVVNIACAAGTTCRQTSTVVPRRAVCMTSAQLTSIPTPTGVPITKKRCVSDPTSGVQQSCLDIGGSIQSASCATCADGCDSGSGSCYLTPLVGTQCKSSGGLCQSVSCGSGSSYSPNNDCGYKAGGINRLNCCVPDDPSTPKACFSTGIVTGNIDLNCSPGIVCSSGSPLPCSPVSSCAGDGSYPIGFQQCCSGLHKEVDSTGFSYCTSKVCTDNSMRCVGQDSEKCVNNSWVSSASCVNGCDSTTGMCKISGPCSVQGGYACNGANSYKCTGGYWLPDASCMLGCDSSTGVCKSTPTLAPTMAIGGCYNNCANSGTVGSPQWQACLDSCSNYISPTRIPLIPSTLPVSISSCDTSCRSRGLIGSAYDVCMASCTATIPVPTRVPGVCNYSTEYCSSYQLNGICQGSCVNIKTTITPAPIAPVNGLCKTGTYCTSYSLPNASGQLLCQGSCAQIPATPTLIPRITIVPVPTRPNPVPTQPGTPNPGPGPQPPSNSSSCSTHSLQARVQPNATTALTTNLSIASGATANITCTHDGTGTLATNVKITAIHNTNSSLNRTWTQNNVTGWAPADGIYTIYCEATDNSCSGLRSDSSQLNVGGSGSCKECPNNFQCYGNPTYGYKWFVPGYQMSGFDLSVPAYCAGIPVPTWKGKAKGDANCDGVIDGADYSIWRKEYKDVSNGQPVSSTTWESDFSCDRVVDGNDFSIWRRSYIDLGGGN